MVSVSLAVRKRWPRAEFSHERHHGGRIHSPAQEDSERYIRDQAQPYRFAELCQHRLCPFVVGPGAFFLGRNIPVRLAARALAVHQQQMSGQELLDSPVKRLRRGHVTKTEEVIDRLRLDFERLARELAQGAQFGREDDAARFEPVEKRLDADAVAGQQQPPRAGIPEGKSKHAAQVIHASEAVVFVEVEDGLRIARGPKAVAARRVQP